MRVLLSIDGRDLVLEIQPGRDSGGTWRIHRESEPEREASVAQVEADTYSVLIDGRSIEARVETAPEGMIVVAGGRRFAVAIRDPRRWNGGSRHHSTSGRQSVAAPMPGKVVRLLVAAGDMVETGQGLVVVEAMKMQNELRSPKDGRVLSVAAVEGSTVAAGDVLVVVE